MVGDAELLDRAASELAQLLSGTTTGRWQVDGPWYHPIGGEGSIEAEMVTAGPDRAAVLIGPLDLGDRDSGADLRYVVAVQPAVGHALVRWLQDAAREAREVGSNPWAVETARAILGEEQGSG